MLNGENIDDLMEAEPEIKVNDDGTVDVVGQDAEKSAPAVEEVEKVQEEETEPVEEEVNPIQKAFTEAGLEKQFPGGVEEMIRRVPELNKYKTQLEQQNAEYRKQFESQPKKEIEKPSIDDFYNNPTEVIEKLVNQRVAAVEEKMEQQEIKNFIASKEDYKTMLPEMTNQLELNPGLEYLPKPEAVRVLYQLAKAAQIPAMVSDATRKVQKTIPDRSKAESSPGKSQKGTVEKSVDDWINMPLKEMEKELGVNDS